MQVTKALSEQVTTKVVAALQTFVRDQGGSVFTSSPALVLQQIKVHDYDRFKAIATILDEAGYAGHLAKRTPSYSTVIMIFQGNLEHWDFKMWMKGTAPRPQLVKPQDSKQNKATEETDLLDRMFAAISL